MTTSPAPQDIYGFRVKSIDGGEVPLSEFAGKVLLVVNVASKCGFTPQYEGLERLQETYGPRGFAVLGFPCNQFGNQEPGSDSDIQTFCTLTYGVKFPIFSKIDVNGADAEPLFEFLKKEEPGILGTEAIKWNFTKFLIGKDGKVVKRYAPTTKPAEIAGAIEQRLQASPGRN